MAGEQGEQNRQDEIHVISAVIVSIRAGDSLFVPARMERQFFEFSEDFRTWGIFLGPEIAR